MCSSTYTYSNWPVNALATCVHIISYIFFFFPLIQGLVSEQALHEVMVANLPGKSEKHLRALQSTALQVAAGPKSATIDYIKLMTPVSKGY